MTTPGGVPNLPLGALTLETLADNLQNMSGAAMKSRAVERFPSIMNNSTGLNPALDITPFGILTRIWGEVNSLVANADPADIQGPEDIPDLLLEFIEGIPVVGQFVILLEAILGNYDGDDQVLNAIQTIFAPIRSLLQLVTGQSTGFPTPEEVTAGFENLFEGLGEGVQDTLDRLSDLLNIDFTLPTFDVEASIRAFLSGRLLPTGLLVGRGDVTGLREPTFPRLRPRTFGAVAVAPQTDLERFFAILRQLPDLTDPANLDPTVWLKKLAQSFQGLNVLGFLDPITGRLLNGQAPQILFDSIATMQNALNGIVNGIVNSTPQIPFVSDFLNGIFNFFSQFGNTVVNAGNAALTALVSGIGVATNIANGIVKSIVFAQSPQDTLGAAGMVTRTIGGPGQWGISGDGGTAWRYLSNFSTVKSIARIPDTLLSEGTHLTRMVMNGVPAAPLLGGVAPVTSIITRINGDMTSWVEANWTATEMRIGFVDGGGVWNLIRTIPAPTFTANDLFELFDGVNGTLDRFILRLNGTTLFDELMPGAPRGSAWRYSAMSQTTGLNSDGSPFLPTSIRALAGGDFQLAA